MNFKGAELLSGDPYNKKGVATSQKKRRLQKLHDKPVLMAWILNHLFYLVYLSFKGIHWLLNKALDRLELEAFALTGKTNG